MKKGSLSSDELISLCDRVNDRYESKQGESYVSALDKVLKMVNKNDMPFLVKQIKAEPTVKDFDLPDLKDFEYTCDLRASPMVLYLNGERIGNEKIEPFNFQGELQKNIFYHSLGVVYMITCVVDGEEHIIKFGQTRTPFSNRLSSYNCGTVMARKNGTCSTTNFKITQSFVATRLTFKLYILDCSSYTEQFTWSNITSVPFASPRSLAIEDIVIKEFIKKYGQPPLANIQSNATKVSD